MFDSPRDGTKLIKRIVAVGGDEVTLEAGRLTINGRPLAAGGVETYDETLALLNLEHGGGPNIAPMIVPAGMVLALGDHRGDSVDGRYFGPIDERELYGRAVPIYYRRGDGFVWRSL